MLNIGDFARYAGVSVRMLRHYDALGLLVPTEVDPHTGYRRYADNLLFKAHQLVALKELGFSLDDVGALLDGRLSTAEIRELLVNRQARLAAQIAVDQLRLGEVERRLQLLEGDAEVSEAKYVEKELPALQLTGVTDFVADTGEVGPRIGPMFEQLVRDLLAGGRKVGHPGYAWYSGDGNGLRIGAGFEVAGDPPAGTRAVELVAVPRAMTTKYTGPISDIGQAWQTMGQHIAALGLEFRGPCREVYLFTGEAVEDQWVVELQQPVG